MKRSRDAICHICAAIHLYMDRFDKPTHKRVENKFLLIAIFGYSAVLGVMETRIVDCVFNNLTKSAVLTYSINTFVMWDTTHLWMVFNCISDGSEGIYSQLCPTWGGAHGSVWQMACTVYWPTSKCVSITILLLFILLSSRVKSVGVSTVSQCDRMTQIYLERQ